MNKGNCAKARENVLTFDLYNLHAVTFMIKITIYFKFNFVFFFVSFKVVHLIINCLNFCLKCYFP